MGPFLGHERSRCPRRLLFDDEAVRVLEVTVEPSERENLHHHRWPSIRFA
jgi:hypothetical protein